MKKLVMMVAMMAGTAMADYAYLYWEVNPGTTEGWLADGRAFDYAYLRATDQGGQVIGDVIRNYDSDGNPAGGLEKSWSTGDGAALTTEVPVYGDISAYASSLYGFVVEAYLNGEILWTSGVSYYDDLVRGNHIWNGDVSSMTGDLTAKAFMVPEPTGGLLLLLGLASLALRRKRGEGEGRRRTAEC